MSRAFEDVASQELDVLYRGALFLSGGDAQAAERLLSDAVTDAFRERVRDAKSVPGERTLQRYLVRSFLGEGTRPEADGDSEPRFIPEPAPGAFAGVGPELLYSVAGTIPPWPRAVIWLVLVQRWSYQQTATTLEVDRRVVVELLRYRDAFVRELMRPSRKRESREGSADGL